MYYNSKARSQFSYILILQFISLVVSFICLLLVKLTNSNLDQINSTYLFITFLELFGRIFQQNILKRIYQEPPFHFYPMNIYSIQKRLGQFVIIVLGESFIALIGLTPSGGEQRRIINFLFCSLTLIFRLDELFCTNIPTKIFYIFYIFNIITVCQQISSMLFRDRNMII